MKRIFLCVLALLLCVSILCACGDDTKSSEKAASGNSESKSAVDLAAVMDDISKQFDLSALKAIEDKETLELYYQITASNVKQCAALMSTDTSVNPQEVILVEAVDENAAKEVETTLKNIQQSRLSNAKSYTPELVDLYESCDVVVDGVYVSLIIETRADEIREVYDSYFK